MPSSINPVCNLPDLPRWVHARAAVMRGDCDVFGMPGEQACIVRATRSAVATVIGQPSTELLLRAVDIVGNDVELLVMHEDAQHVRRVLRYWQELPAVLHAWPDRLRSPAQPQPGVRLYDPWHPRQKRGFCDKLKREVRTASIVAARRVGQKVVAVCHTDAVTEQWWDVAIDTVEAHRRHGHARACFQAMAAHLHGLGRQPVWGSLLSNTASMNMAASLGMVPVDQLSVFLSPNRAG